MNFSCFDHDFSIFNRKHMIGLASAFRDETLPKMINKEFKSGSSSLAHDLLLSSVSREESIQFKRSYHV